MQLAYDPARGGFEVVIPGFRLAEADVPMEGLEIIAGAGDVTLKTSSLRGGEGLAVSMGEGLQSLAQWPSFRAEDGEDGMCWVAIQLARGTIRLMGRWLGDRPMAVLVTREDFK